jgi:pyruvate,water dikinase
MADYYQWELKAWDEERDMAAYKGWMCDARDTVRTRSIFDFWMFVGVYADYPNYAAEWLQIPTTKGLDLRVKDGWAYLAVNVVPEKDRPQREAEFRKRIAPWIEDFESNYKRDIAELEKQAAPLKALYPDVKKLNAAELKEAFEDWIHMYRSGARYHFRWLYIVCIVSNMFHDLCGELLGINRHDRLYNDVMAGIDHKVIQSDREMWRLGRMAVEMGLQSIFESTKDNREVLQKISQQGEAGKRWLDELNKVLEVYGWRTSRNWDASSPSWLEDPSLTFGAMRTLMHQPEFAVDRAHQGLLVNKQKAQEELLSRVPESKREWFGKLLNVSQWTSIVQEEHPFYTEQIGNSVGRFITKEIGERWARDGAIDDPDDIYSLVPDEISVRIIHSEKNSPGKIIKIRKQQHDEFLKAEPQMFLGDQNAFFETMKYEPLVMGTISPSPRVRPELKADLYGTIAVPGVAEGIARVLTTVDEAGEFKPGEIIVTVETNVEWNPLFGIAAAVITDAGGVLSHASIAAREYGIPVVSGTLDATRKIKTGMKIRVDGDEGTVYILDKG